MPVASGQSGRLPVDFPFPLKRDILFGIFYTVDTSENYRRLPAFTIGVIWGKKKRGNCLGVLLNRRQCH
jgi:hypothetical protein